AETAGSEAWIALQQQRLAGFAALGQHVEAAQVLDALREHAGRVVAGELVLGGTGMGYAEASLRDRVLAAAADDPLSRSVADYLRAGAQARKSAIGPMRKLSKDADLVGTPVHFMASYRVLLHEAQRRPGAAANKELVTFLGRYRHPEFGYVATAMMTSDWWSKPSLKIEAWEALAAQGGRWKFIALHEAGLAAYQHGKNADAAARFERAFREAARDDALPIVDWSVQYAMTSTLGEAGWQLAWTRLRERVAKSKDPSLAIGFMQMAQTLGRGDEAQRVLEALDPESMDPQLALVTFDALLAYAPLFEELGAGTFTLGGGGADLSPLTADGMLGIGLHPDTSHYF
ncbi:MAG: hypothetical protein KC457_34050, partial [Myxococcales bacterium]|nr:hypothetical protein [Myxococcales bacterium]